MQYLPKCRKSSYLQLRQADLIPFAENVYQKMSTNSDYTDMEALYTKLNEKLTIFKNALAATKDGGRLLTAAKDKAKKELYDILNIIANTLDSNAEGNELYILNAGMQLQRKGTRHLAEEIPVPSDFVVSTTLQPGTVEVTFTLDAIPKLIGIATEWTPVDVESWKNGTYGGKNVRKINLKDLPSMTEVYVRVRAICENGRNSEWTEKARVKVL